MTVYPNAFDDDRTIIRIDDNLSELGVTTINQIRSAIFAMQKEMGITPSGSLDSIANRLDVSLNTNGTIKVAAIAAAGLVSLPIVNHHIATNAGIEESKLDLNVSTSDLQIQITSIDTIINKTSILATNTNTNLLTHINGGAFLLDGITGARHLDNQIDLSIILLDKNSLSYGGTTVATALNAINTELTNHESSIANAHPATAITVDYSDWTELPQVSNAQQVFDFIDGKETLSTGIDRATLNSNGILRNSRAYKDPDGYHENIIPITRAFAFLAEPSQTNPRDSISNGDDIISFYPEDNSDYKFDEMFVNVKVGDIARVDYGNGIVGIFKISSIRFDPGTEWVIRINGFNKFNCDGVSSYAYVRIDRTKHDKNTYGVLAIAPVIADVFPDGGCSNALDSVIIGSPQGAMTLGIGFDPNKIDSYHYNLWLRLYPDGNPENGHTDLPPIDVTGNAGVTPGSYTLETIVDATNRGFRAAGYNFRFIAFSHNGEFGIMLADSYNNAAFSIISGSVVGTSIAEGIYIYNVIGDATDGKDGLGLGTTRAKAASPVHGTWTSSLQAASFPTVIHSVLKNKSYFVDGAKRDVLNSKNLAGYWEAQIYDVYIDNPNNTVTSIYRISENLMSEELRAGKTIVVLPEDSSTQSIVGYGRFIIGNVVYNTADGYTDIMVINACHATVNPLSTNYLPVGSNVRVYFSEDSVGFNVNNLSGQEECHRYHEIYIDSSGNTFAVERARMEKQILDLDKLNTTLANWRIKNVSPKFTGTRDNVNFKYWTRLTLNYNSVLGEFDGYLSNPNGDNPGPVSYGFKNHPIRFYDNTGINFIDIEFKEISTNPGTSISPGYIDIEIFESTVLDQEVMRLAGVSHNERLISAITDLRDFGTTSEENFTDSAVRFIQAGERYLHTNGVVRGFDYIEAVNNSTLFFDGGMVLVNGKFVAVDALSVDLPVIRPVTSSNYNLFVCITEGGQLIAVPENTNQEFFTLDGHFIPSLSFKNIVNTRKDLTIVAVATVNVTGTAITSLTVTDARRFVWNESSNTWSIAVIPENYQMSATFHSWEAADNWVRYYDVNSIEIKEVYTETIGFAPSHIVKLWGGTLAANSINLINVHLDKVNISNYESGDCNVILNAVKVNQCNITLNTLTAFNSHFTQSTITSSETIVTFNSIYDNVKFYISAFDNISLLNDVTFVNNEVHWTVPIQSYVADDMVNWGTGYAIKAGTNVFICNNKFNSTASSNQRPPVIVNLSTINSKINILYNKFFDNAALDNSAICFSHSTSSNPSLLDVTIIGNQCGNLQNIILAPTDASVYPGWISHNVSITNNKCGIIGYLATTDNYGSGFTINGNKTYGITTAIAVKGAFGHFSVPAVGNGSGTNFIYGNTVRGNILVGTRGVLGYYSSLNINNNYIIHNITATIYKWLGVFNVTKAVANLDFSASDAAAKFSICNIHHNSVYLTDGGIYGSITAGAISTVGVSNITNNYIEVATSNLGSCVLISNTPFSAGTGFVQIANNILNRGTNNIASYIYCAPGVQGYVIDNYLSNSLVGGYNWQDAINVGSNDILVERNKNHRVEVLISADTILYYLKGIGGTYVFYPTLSDVPNVVSPTEHSFLQHIHQYRIETDTIVSFETRIPLNGFIPYGAKLFSISLGFTVAPLGGLLFNSTDFTPSSQLYINIYDNGSAVSSNGFNINTSTTGIEVVEVLYSSTYNSSSNITINIGNSVGLVSGTGAYRVSTGFANNGLKITYTW